MAKVNLRAKLLEKKIQKASKDYYENSESSVSDAEFDRDQKELKEISPDSPVLQQIGADEEGLRKVEHTIPMGSLENCMNVPEVLKWAKGFSESMVLSRKVDGASLSLYYEDGVLQEATTRGNGKIGADVMFSIQHLPDIQMLESPYTGHVRGECYLKKSNFDDINKKKLERGEEPFKIQEMLPVG
jgi:DNA ligase (NAD+)